MSETQITQPQTEYINGLLAHGQLNDYENLILQRIIETPGKFVNTYLRGVTNKFKAKTALKNLVDNDFVKCDDFRFYPVTQKKYTVRSNSETKTNCLRSIQMSSRKRSEDELSSSSTETTLKYFSGGEQNS
jgi:hypothetical protein